MSVTAGGAVIPLDPSSMHHHHPHHQSPLRHHPASMGGGGHHPSHGVHHPYDTMVGPPPPHSVADYDPANISISTASMLMGGSASVSAQHAAAAASFSMNNNHHVLGSYSAYPTYAQVQGVILFNLIGIHQFIPKDPRKMPKKIKDLKG